MAKAKRNVGREILDGLREIKRGEHGQLSHRLAAARRCPDWVATRLSSAVRLAPGNSGPRAEVRRPEMVADNRPLAPAGCRQGL